MNLAHAFYRAIWRSPLPLRLRKFSYKGLSRYESPPSVPFSKDFFGLRYDGNLINSIDFHIFNYGAFEKPLLFFLRDASKNLARYSADGKPVFVDVGANIGQHSLFMARYGGQVHAFEPYPQVRERLRHHIEINHITNITVHPYGLGERMESLPFYAPTGRNQGIGSFDATTVSKGNAVVGTLELVSGDRYFHERGIPMPNLIKIDVEGFEQPALRGLRSTLEESRPVVVVEVTYGGALSFASRSQLEQALPADYALYAFDTRKADGRKARRRGLRARRSGEYHLVPLRRWRQHGQDNIVACPVEKLDALPLQGAAGNAHH